jgi:hypothetical protein
MNRIEIRIRNVYGENKAYPVCEAAQNFAAIAGSKTLTFGTLQLISRLGYQIDEINSGLTVLSIPAGVTAITSIRKLLASN